MASTEETRVIVERVVDWVHSEAQRIGEQLAAAKVAEAQAVAALAGRQAEQLRAERDELRQVGRALVAGLESSEGDWPAGCNAPRCRRLATYDDGDQVACDEHQGMLVAGDIEDLSYAPTYRRLRDLTKEGT